MQHSFLNCLYWFLYHPGGLSLMRIGNLSSQVFISTIRYALFAFFGTVCKLTGSFGTWICISIWFLLNVACAAKSLIALQQYFLTLVTNDSLLIHYGPAIQRLYGINLYFIFKKICAFSLNQRSHWCTDAEHD